MALGRKGLEFAGHRAESFCRPWEESIVKRHRDNSLLQELTAHRGNWKWVDFFSKTNFEAKNVVISDPWHRKPSKSETNNQITNAITY